MTGQRRGFVLGLLGLSLGCSEAAPAGPAAPTRFLFSVGEGADAVRLEALPLRLSVGAAAPRGDGLLQVALRPNGPSRTRFHDPRQPTPPEVTWHTVDRLLRVDAARREAVLAVSQQPGAGEVTVSLSQGAREGVRLAVRASGPDVALVRVVLPREDGPYDGLGERFGALDARGAVHAMQLHIAPGPSGTNEVHCPVPWLISPARVGYFVESTEAGAFDLGAAAADSVHATFEGNALTLRVFTAPEGRRPALVARFAREMGLPRLPPRWSFAPQHWRNEWRNRDELLGDAREIRQRHIATTTLWIDNPWSTAYMDHTVDTARFADPPAMMATLQAMGFRVLFWSVPYLDAVEGAASPRNTAERRWVEAREAGHLVRGPSGAPYVSPLPYGAPGGMRDAAGSLVDFTSAAAEAWWAAQLVPLVQLGARAFKLDYAEDIVPDLGGVRTRFGFASNANERTGRWAYPQGYHRAYRRALDLAAGGDGFVMGRASSWGGQAAVDVIWPGDLDNDFSEHVPNQNVGGLPAAIHAMLSLAASGFPNFASDTGGYRGGRPSREVLLRWAEHTALSPMMQLGGGGESHNPWSYDEEASTLYRGLARLHQQLVPYLYAQASRASREGTPPVTPLRWQDGLARAPDDDLGYLLGDALFVAPVTREGAAARTTVLPPGAWVHWYSGRAFSGEATVPAPLGRPAFFVRQGALFELGDADLDTLVDASAPGVIDPADRAAVRTVLWAPEVGFRGGAALEGASVEVEGAGLRWAPDGAVGRLRVVALGGVRAVGEGATLREDPLASEGRCVDCWHYDGALGRVDAVLASARAMRVEGR